MNKAEIIKDIINNLNGVIGGLEALAKSCDKQVGAKEVEDIKNIEEIVKAIETQPIANQITANTTEHKEANNLSNTKEHKEADTINMERASNGNVKDTKPTKTEEPLTIEIVRAALVEKSKSGKQAQVKALITSYGVQRLTEIPASKYEEVMKKAGEI